MLSTKKQTAGDTQGMVPLIQSLKVCETTEYCLGIDAWIEKNIKIFTRMIYPHTPDTSYFYEEASRFLFAELFGAFNMSMSPIILLEKFILRNVSQTYLAMEPFSCSTLLTLPRTV